MSKKRLLLILIIIAEIVILGAAIPPRLTSTPRLQESPQTPRRGRPGE